MPEDFFDVQKIMVDKRWNLESIITHEYPLSSLKEALVMASDINQAENVIIKI